MFQSALVHQIIQLFRQVYDSWILSQFVVWQCLATRFGVRAWESGFPTSQAIQYRDNKMARPGRDHIQFTGIRTTKMPMFSSGCSRNCHCICQLVIGVFVQRPWDRTHVLLNTNAETTHCIQDALVANVYTSAKAVLAQASVCQVSGQTSAWVTQVHVDACVIASTCKAEAGAQACLVMPRAMTLCHLWKCGKACRYALDQGIHPCPRMFTH